jgi:hypothetical protein
VQGCDHQWRARKVDQVPGPQDGTVNTRHIELSGGDLTGWFPSCPCRHQLAFTDGQRPPRNRRGAFLRLRVDFAQDLAFTTKQTSVYEELQLI